MSGAAPPRGGPFLWLVRHAETAWSRIGRHTSRTDLPLTPEGERLAKELAPIIRGRTFARVWSSPRRRATRTCELFGLASSMTIDPDLAEWDYGDFEGRTSAEIQREHPGWDLWRNGCPRGETLEQVSARAQRVVARAAAVLSEGGEVAIFSHGHFLRALASAWLELPASRGRSFALHADSISILGHEHGNRVIWSWDWTPHLLARGH